MRLHHVNVVVPPGTTSDVLPFYVLLGLTPVSKLGENTIGAWFDLPDGRQIHLSERAGAVHPEQHFALVVDDLAAVVQALRAAGHPWSDKPPIGGARRGMTADPQGNAIELVESAGPFA